MSELMNVVDRYRDHWYQTGYDAGYEQGKKDAVVHGRWKLFGNDDDVGSSYWCSACHFALSEDLFYIGYKDEKHECIDEMVALFGKDAVAAFCRCCVYKYRYRADMKGGRTDREKADWYMDKLIELEGKP